MLHSATRPKLSSCAPLSLVTAEPAVHVLNRQVETITNGGISQRAMMLSLSIGVACSVGMAMLRVLTGISIYYILVPGYIAALGLTFCVPKIFTGIAFDSGGVTTGPVTVPFIMALGVGLASIRGDSGAQEDSFGLVALCSIGPVLAVLLLGIFYPTNGAGYTAVTVPDVENTRQAAHTFVVELPAYIHEVLSALVPIILFCAVFQLIFRRFHAMQLRKIGVGFVYTFTGLSLFLTGVNVGFMPVGHYLGQQLALSGQEWVLVPLGMLIGYFLVTAEPAVHVLNRQGVKCLSIRAA